MSCTTPSSAAARKDGLGDGGDDNSSTRRSLGYLAGERGGRKAGATAGG